MKEEATLPRSFKGMWIPVEIWLHPEYSIKEKMLLCEINSLDTDEEKGCYASNEYLAAFMGEDTSPKTVANMLSVLRGRGAVMDVFREGHNRGLRSLLHRPDGATKPTRRRAVVETFYDPDKPRVISETEKAIGFNLDIWTAERIIAAVPEHLTDCWIDLVKDRLIGQADSSANYLKARIGYWLSDFKKNVWRYEKDLAATATSANGSARTNQSFKLTNLCDDCRGLNGFRVIEGRDGLVKCDHKRSVQAA